jgi:FlaA1/EpsC-like NDP-sugar epimerase
MELDFEALVGRPKRAVQLTGEEADFFSNLKIAVTGGVGSIGGAIALQLLKETSGQVFLIDCDESRLHTYYVNLSADFRTRTQTQLADIRDSISISSTLQKIRPDLVIHAAALKHVSVLENSPREAFLTNVLGTVNVLNAAKEVNPKSFVFVSTDKAANPINILGKTKLIGEYLTAASSSSSHSTSYGVVRFGNVFLSRGSVLETFIAQINQGEELTITDPSMDRFFIDLTEASALILKTISAKQSGVSILKMGQSVKIIDLVDRLISKIGRPISYQVIGKKSGEKITEDLFTDKEAAKTKDFNDYSFAEYSMKIESLTHQDLNPNNDAEDIALIDRLLRDAHEM